MLPPRDFAVLERQFPLNIIHKELKRSPCIKGVLSRGFRTFLVLTVAKSVVGDLTNEKHYF